MSDDRSSSEYNSDVPPLLGLLVYWAYAKHKPRPSTGVARTTEGSVNRRARAVEDATILSIYRKSVADSLGGLDLTYKQRQLVKPRRLYAILVANAAGEPLGEHTKEIVRLNAKVMMCLRDSPEEILGGTKEET